jgi:hypothetical protein
VPCGTPETNRQDFIMSNISNNIFGIVVAIVASAFGFALTLI